MKYKVKQTEYEIWQDELSKPKRTSRWLAWLLAAGLCAVFWAAVWMIWGHGL